MSLSIGAVPGLVQGEEKPKVDGANLFLIFLNIIIAFSNFHNFAGDWKVAIGKKIGHSSFPYLSVGYYEIECCSF